MFKRLALLGLGWLFILLGIAGLFLPVLQGILFLCVGIIILSSEYIWARRILEKLRTRFPAVDRRCDRAFRIIASLRARFVCTSFTDHPESRKALRAAGVMFMRKICSTVETSGHCLGISSRWAASNVLDQTDRACE
jgi:hypothetical protein